MGGLTETILSQRYTTDMTVERKSPKVPYVFLDVPYSSSGRVETLSWHRRRQPWLASHGGRRRSYGSTEEGGQSFEMILAETGARASQQLVDLSPTSSCCASDGLAHCSVGFRKILNV